MTFFFDNQAIHKILEKEGKFQPNIEQVNSKIGKAIANSTIPFRFKGELNVSQRKLATNMDLFPRLHFMTLA